MNTITLPGLIDIHVHLRDPGQTHKEDFTTGTMAAIAGGFTTVLDMPNNTVPITTFERLQAKMQDASEKTVANIGFHFGSLGDNIDQFDLIRDKVFGIKIYLNPTTGNYMVNGDVLEKVYSAWEGTQPILLHAEEDTLIEVFETVKKYPKKTHICHVSSRNELTHILKAKADGLPVTCGICPHHLFLSEKDVERLGPYGRMKPPLKSQDDVDFLWSNLASVDVIESDHAPHTIEEKNSETPPFGVPGLETTLPLLFLARHEGKLTTERIIELCHTNPARIFNVPTSENTHVIVEEGDFIIEGKNLFSKCKWTPFEGMHVPARVVKVVIEGKTVFENGNMLVYPGEGKVISPLI